MYNGGMKKHTEQGKKQAQFEEALSREQDTQRLFTEYSELSTSDKKRSATAEEAVTQRDEEQLQIISRNIQAEAAVVQRNLIGGETPNAGGLFAIPTLLMATARHLLSKGPQNIGNSRAIKAADETIRGLTPHLRRNYTREGLVKQRQGILRQLTGSVPAFMQVKSKRPGTGSSNDIYVE